MIIRLPRCPRFASGDSEVATADADDNCTLKEDNLVDSVVERLWEEFHFSFLLQLVQERSVCRE